MRNQVFDFLSRKRVYCMKQCFKQDLFMIQGENSKREFYESYIDNSAFDFASNLYGYLDRYIEKCENPVLALAIPIYDALEQVKKRCEDLGYNDSFPPTAPNFKTIKDAVQILNVLKEHFTCEYSNNFSRDATMKSKSLNPKEWLYLPTFLIEEKLRSKDEEIFENNNCVVYNASPYNLSLAVCELGMHSRDLFIFSKEALKLFIEAIQVDSHADCLKYEISEDKVTISYRFYMIRGESGESYKYVDLVFVHKSDQYYSLDFHKEYYSGFDAIEYRQLPCETYVVGTKECIFEYKKSDEYYKEDHIAVLSPKNFEIFDCI